MNITVIEPPEEGIELKMVAFRAMEDFPSPAGGRIVYCPESPEDPRSSPFGPRQNCKAYIMSHYAQMEGWQPAGIVAMGYGQIQKGQLFWAITNGPAQVLMKTKGDS